MEATDMEKSAVTAPSVSNSEIRDTDQTWRKSKDNPLNWPRSKKYQTIGLVSFQAFISPLASSIMAPGLPELAEKYNIKSDTVLALTLTIYLLAWALGPLAFAPLSEMYGRRWVINISSVIFTAFSIGCIFAKSTGQLIAFRFLAGIGASTPISIAGAVIADLYILEERAPASAIYGLGLLIGPPTGPIMGGYLTQTVGVRYGFVLTAALGAVALVLSVFLLPETDHAIIRSKRGSQRGGLTGLFNKKAEASVDDKRTQSSTPLTGSAREAAIRPLVLLTRSPICFILSFYGALVYGFLNMFFTTFPTIFGEIYGFKPGPTGLTYIGGGLGELCATALGGWVGNTVYHNLTKKNGGIPKPEFRMPGMLLGSVAVPIGLFWFGWTAQTHQHWMLPIIGSSIFGFGMMSILLPLQLYFIDAFKYSAAALAAASLARSLLAFAIPLFAPQMIDAMGLGGTYSFLGGLSIAIGIPLPLWVYFQGEKIRARSDLNH
ncbi:Efflux pump vrtL [Trichoderma lentiforme]|uniref:Efflux pump vrtL n=1 Tax=Trichoderma lentiforme TaxID=1567552 RepID=A0A9P4XBX1_9HYPO|nr:Efflux pump vrtL [Trichoderma lentiforme]